MASSAYSISQVGRLLQPAFPRALELKACASMSAPVCAGCGDERRDLARLRSADHVHWRPMTQRSPLVRVCPEGCPAGKRILTAGGRQGLDSASRRPCPYPTIALGLPRGLGSNLADEGGEMNQVNARHEIISEWRWLPKEQRQTDEQAEAFAMQIKDKYKFSSDSADPYQTVRGWLLSYLSLTRGLE
jgi:hypothetical protein